MIDEDALSGHLREFEADAQNLVDRAREAGEAFERGDLQTACNTIAISHYVLSHLRDERASVLRMLEAQGVKPGGR
jgi:hypothetical protein